MRVERGLLLLAAVLAVATACNQDFDPADRRAARIDQYEMLEQSCEVVGDRAVATGILASRADEPQGFGVVVRFFDGDVDLGRPQNVNHPEPIDPGDRWSWEAAVDAGGLAGELRCDVIQVVIGDDVDR